jgi:hypothetical protein
MQIPGYMKALVAAVRTHGRGLAGDNNAGWAAIAEYWETDDIARALALARCRTPRQAIERFDAIAKEILQNHAAFRA